MEQLLLNLGYIAVMLWSILFILITFIIFGFIAFYIFLYVILKIIYFIKFVYVKIRKTSSRKYKE